MSKIILTIYLFILLSGCNDQQQGTQKNTNDTTTKDQTVKLETTDKDITINGWKTYKNDRYAYYFQYLGDAKISEAEITSFSLSPEDIEAGLSFEDLYTKYTGKICVSIDYGYGGITISAPPNNDMRYVMCGRTGVGDADDIRKKEEKFIIQGKEYTATGSEITYGDGKVLSNHSESMVIKLEDGTTISYGSYPKEGVSWEDYLKIKKDLVNIIESYIKIN